jgi:hypothetical protein
VRNLDHLKAIAEVIRVWRTQHLDKVEHRWTLAMAELPGSCCPAPRGGGNDCKSRPAHL